MEQPSDELSPWGSDDCDPEGDERLRAIGRLAAGISHELSNQLTILGGLVDEILQGAELGAPLDRGAAAALQHVQRRMKELCLGMRDLVRGRPLQVLGRADAVGVVQHLLRVLDRVGITKCLTVQVHVPAEPVWVPLRDYALEQVLLNFVLNAISALELVATQSLTITVRTTATCVELEVEDDGPGLPAARLETLFDRARTARPGGTGLGLQMARRFAREAGGDTFARTPDHGGLVVGLCLPHIS